MQVKHVTIKRFRGIKSLDWHIGGRIICLVGPGDSTKTTILDAIDYALGARWHIPFTDADFYKGDVSKDIIIDVTVGDLPDELITEDKFGTYLRGYSNKASIKDDPDDDCEPVLTIRLQVGNDLEPQWNVIKESNPEPRRISWRDRERLGLARLGNDPDRHFTWSRGSALAKITNQEASTGQTLANANRAACNAIAKASLSELIASARTAQRVLTEFGVKIASLRPALDTKSLAFGIGTISLHDDRVPLRAFGLGTTRLAALAVQQIGLGRDAILLIDEIEHGLEPHRIRQLLKKLCNDKIIAQQEASGRTIQPHGQVIMTTHSPTPIIALPVTSLRFVFSKNGQTTVKKVDPAQIDSVQGVVRSRSHALLARKIIVCEGKTEEALCRVLSEVWANEYEGESLSYYGVVPIDGQGRNKGPSSAIEFRRLGYQVLFWGDTDEPIEPNKDELKAEGVEVVLWPGNMSTEERITADLPFSGLQDLVNAAIDEKGEERVLSAISTLLDHNVVVHGSQLTTWVGNGVDEKSIRSAIGKAAKKTLKGWFKDINCGERLGRIVAQHLPAMQDTELVRTLNKIKTWVYDE